MDSIRPLPRLPIRTRSGLPIGRRRLPASPFAARDCREESSISPTRQTSSDKAPLRRMTSKSLPSRGKVCEMEAGAVSNPIAPPSPLRHFLYVTAALSITEFKLRYFGSVLGYLWSFIRPFLLFGVLYVVFTKIVRAGTAVPHYPVLLLLALVLFNFFSEATG